MPEAEIWQLLLGAALAIMGGVFAELWREGRANRADVRALLGEVEGLLAVCERMRQAPRVLSFSHFLPELQSYARSGAGASRGWLRAITEAEDRNAILKVFGLASSAAGTIETFVANETEALNDGGPTRYHALIEMHRDVAETGIILVEHQARTLIARLEALETRPVLL